MIAGKFLVASVFSVQARELVITACTSITPALLNFPRVASALCCFAGSLHADSLWNNGNDHTEIISFEPKSTGSPHAAYETSWSQPLTNSTL